VELTDARWRLSPCHILLVVLAAGRYFDVGQGSVGLRGGRTGRVGFALSQCSRVFVMYAFGPIFGREGRHVGVFAVHTEGECDAVDEEMKCRKLLEGVAWLSRRGAQVVRSLGHGASARSLDPTPPAG
jgi:hypothetical protein